MRRIPSPRRLYIHDDISEYGWEVHGRTLEARAMAAELLKLLRNMQPRVVVLDLEQQLAQLLAGGRHQRFPGSSRDWTSRGARSAPGPPTHGLVPSRAPGRRCPGGGRTRGLSRGKPHWSDAAEPASGAGGFRHHRAGGRHDLLRPHDSNRAPRDSTRSRLPCAAVRIAWCGPDRCRTPVSMPGTGGL